MCIIFSRMRSRIIPIIFSLLAFVCVVRTQDIEWQTDFKQASQTARDSGRPMLLDFSAVWCKPCQKMEKEFWIRPEVIELSKKFVCVKLNFDKEGGLAHHYGVSGIPNVVTTDPWGVGLNNSLGYGSGDGGKIIKGLAAVPTDFSPIKNSALALETNKEDIDALSKIAAFYDQKEFYYQASIYWKRLLKLPIESSQREVLLINMGLNCLRQGEAGDAEDYFKRFQKDHPQSPNNELALFGLAYVSIQRKKWDAAEKTIAALRTRYPNSKYIARVENDLKRNRETSKK